MKRIRTFFGTSLMAIITLLCVAVFWQRNVGLPELLRRLDWALTPTGFTVTVIFPTVAFLLWQIHWVTKHA